MSLLDFNLETQRYRLHDLLYVFAGKESRGLEATNITLKIHQHAVANPYFLLDSDDFHDVEFNPESHIQFGTALVRRDARKAIEYYSTLLRSLHLYPWILRNPDMAYLAEISAGILVVAYRTVGEPENGKHYAEKAQTYHAFRQQLLARASRAGEVVDGPEQS